MIFSHVLYQLSYPARVPFFGLPIGFSSSSPVRIGVRNIHPTYTGPRRRGLYTSSGFIQTRRAGCPRSPSAGPGSLPACPAPVARARLRLSLLSLLGYGMVARRVPHAGYVRAGVGGSDQARNSRRDLDRLPRDSNLPTESYRVRPRRSSRSSWRRTPRSSPARVLPPRRA
jgi:hypothetical protein